MIQNVQPLLLSYVRTFELQAEAEQNKANLSGIINSELSTLSTTQQVSASSFAPNLDSKSILVVSPSQDEEGVFVLNDQPLQSDLKIKKVIEKVKKIKKTLSVPIVKSSRDDYATLNDQDFNQKFTNIRVEPAEYLSETESTSSLLDEVANERVEEIKGEDIRHGNAKDEEVTKEAIKNEDEKIVFKTIEVSPGIVTTSFSSSIIHPKELKLMRKRRAEQTVRGENDSSKESEASLVDFYENRKGEKGESVTGLVWAKTNEKNGEQNKKEEDKESSNESSFEAFFFEKLAEIRKNIEDELAVYTENTKKSLDEFNKSVIFDQNFEDFKREIKKQFGLILNKAFFEDEAIKYEVTTVASETKEFISSDSTTQKDHKALDNSESLDGNLNETERNSRTHKNPIYHLVNTTLPGSLYGDIKYNQSH